MAYARAVGEYQPPAPAPPLEGLRLHLSSNNATGYKGVRRRHSGSFEVTKCEKGKAVYLGCFGTAVEAAAAYARAVGEAPSRGSG